VHFQIECGHYSDKPIEQADVEEVELKTTKRDPAEARRLEEQTRKMKQKTRSISNKLRQSTSRTTSKRQSGNTSAKDKARCEKYKQRLAQYRREGVEGINPVTGRRGKMTGEGKRQAIENAEASVEAFCN
jgi:wyosine [tRNA(Phe)-imidazoG37] synthetase (radical SAM superfamily)